MMEIEARICYACERCSRLAKYYQQQQHAFMISASARKCRQNKQSANYNWFSFNCMCRSISR